MVIRRPYWWVVLVPVTVNAFKTPTPTINIRIVFRNARSLAVSSHSSDAIPRDNLATFSTTSGAATWHKQRRNQMLALYGDDIIPLERESSSQSVALPLLIMSNTLLLALSILSGSLSLPAVVALSVFPGSILSLWQLQILHDVLHGSFFEKSASRLGGIQKKSLQNFTLFVGSMPSVFGYYLYLKFGHLTHHRNVGNSESASLKTLFDSHSTDFEDGDVLFVAHRMNLTGEVGPTFHLFGKNVTMSISKSGFNAWKRGNYVWNAFMFASSFLLERLLLVINDAVVALTGKNFFFPNKPQPFHQDCTRYARVATLLRIALWKFAGWKSLLFLYLSETLWSIPPHPACAMFVTNHGSSIGTNGECIPTSSTYGGKWYSILTLGTNFHVEHHDFPTIPLNKLGKLRNIAPEFYTVGNHANVWQIMKRAFAHPDFYACTNAGIQVNDGKDADKGEIDGIATVM
jgi:fatty acid desaturase